jgi:1-acyl-sn-glycerol-3-phosphate acyltransferase
VSAESFEKLSPRVDPKVLFFLDSFVEAVSHYFDAQIVGLERIAPGPALFVGNHNSNVVTPDTYLFARAFYHHTHFQEPLVGLAHALVFKIPALRELAAKIGMVSATRENAVSALTDGCKVLVYPGGGWEASRPWVDRDRIDFKNRLGFLRVAATAKCKVIPVVAAGAHDGWHVLTRGEGIAKALGLNRIRVDTFPIAFGLPFGLVVGPMTPFLPPPLSMIIEVLDPIEVSAEPDDTERLQRAYDDVTSQMQECLSRNAARLPNRG